MGQVKVTDNHVEFLEKFSQLSVDFLEEACAELESQIKRNTAVDTGQLKNSWSHVIEREALRGTVGTPLENGIWEEYGTGIYALGGDGRKTPWRYFDRHGKFHTTRGKRPKRMVFNAVNLILPRLQKIAKEKFVE